MLNYLTLDLFSLTLFMVHCSLVHQFDFAFAVVIQPHFANLPFPLSNGGADLVKDFCFPSSQYCETFHRATKPNPAALYTLQMSGRGADVGK